MKIHPRADEPIEMVYESFKEILFTVKRCLDYRKMQDPSYWEPSHSSLFGVLGFPSAILLLSFVDAIGSYYEGNEEMKISLRTERKPYKITSTETHFYILNSEYFNLNLSKLEVKQIYECRGSLLHNNVLTNEIQLIRSAAVPFICPMQFQEGNETKLYLQIRLMSFLEACENAFEIFKNNKELIVTNLKESSKILKHRKSFYSSAAMQAKVSNDKYAIDLDKTQKGF